MLPNLFSSLTESDFSFTPDTEFLNEAVLDLVTAISPDAAAFLGEGLETLETATGELSITAGLLEGVLTTETGEVLPIMVNGPEVLAEAGALLVEAIGSLSLENGFVNGALAIGDDLYEVVNFDLAAFAATGFDFLLSEIDAEIPIVAGQFLIDTETDFGLFAGVIDVTGGLFDVDLTTPAGDLDFTIPFSPDAQFAVPNPLDGTAVIINFFTGNVEVPLIPGLSFEVPLDDLFGELALSEGIATLAVDTFLGPVEVSFAVDELVGDLVFDTLTGVAIEAELLGGNLDFFADSGSETFETVIDLNELNAEVVETLVQTNGDLILDSGLLTGIVAVGDEEFAIAETVDNLVDLLTTPLSDLFALSPAAI